MPSGCGTVKVQTAYLIRVSSNLIVAVQIRYCNSRLVNSRWFADDQGKGLSKMTRRTASQCILLVGMCSAAVMVLQACVKAPVSDEVGQFYASVATVRYGDPAYYRVNPPLHRWISGIVVEAFCDVPLPRPYPASLMASGVRNEFEMGTRAIAASPDQYHWHFLVGRTPRIAIVVAFAWLLLSGFPMLSQRATAIASVFYLTSPLVLGHGWTMMPDALSGCAMILLMALTLRWLNDRTLMNSILVGFAWGVCLNIKFTFCPIYVLWPIVLLAHEASAGQFGWRGLWHLGANHFGHGLIALVVTIIVYEGNDIGVPMQDHPFVSEMFRSLAARLGGLPSPLPKQYLMGIDEQQLFIEKGVPSYFAGTFYPEGMWWYYVVGVFAKEQLAFLVVCVVLVLWIVMRTAKHFFALRNGLPIAQDTRGGERLLHDTQRIRLRSAVWFLLGVATIVFAILSWNSQMALNIRYLFPALPACYLLIGFGLDAFLERTRIPERPVFVIGLLLIGLEVALALPHQFAYINPLFGGSYRVPQLLHDSNFDGGQDVWTLERWNRNHPVGDNTKRYFVFFTEVARSAIELPDAVPSEPMLEALIRNKTTDTSQPNRIPKNESGDTQHVEIIIARCMQSPAPWHRLWDESDHFHDLIHQTATIEPDAVISPTMLLYRFDMIVSNDDDSRDLP